MHVRLFPGLWLLLCSTVSAGHFSSGKEPAGVFGVHEIALSGDDTTANPFDTLATVTFTPPSGAAHAKTVHMFYDGDATWRARVYVSEPGRWSWASSSDTAPELHGHRGHFEASASTLKGRLLPHPRNPRHWMTENGQWFLNLSDTAYFLLCTHDANGDPVTHADFTAYVRDVAAQELTSLRCFATNGARGFLQDEVGRWTDGVFADDACSRLRLDELQVTDRRLRWLLEHHPDLYVQLIVFPRGCRWKTDEAFWAALGPQQKERLLRSMIARFSAYPQLLWLIVNDAHYGPDFPNNVRFAREASEYFRHNDPWKHPLSTGHARGVPFYFPEEQWVTYIHLEDSYDGGAMKYARYHRYQKPVFLGEDRYEQWQPARDPVDMPYFQRRLFWAWLFSGGSANYGGRWYVVHPYSETGGRAAADRSAASSGRYQTPLTGLDSVPYISAYFTERGIELCDYESDHALVQSSAANPIDAPRLTRKGMDDILIYDPHPSGSERHMTPDSRTAPSLRVDLRNADGPYRVEWFRPADGEVLPGDVVRGGAVIELKSPWVGHDVILRLSRDVQN